MSWEDSEVVARLIEIKKGEDPPVEVKAELTQSMVTEFVIGLLSAKVAIDERSHTFNLWILYDGADSVSVNSIMESVRDFSMKVAHKALIATVRGKMTGLGLGSSVTKMIVTTLFNHRSYFNEVARTLGETQGVEGVIKLLMGIGETAAWEKYKE